MNKIHESLLPFAVDIDKLLTLPNNPRRGNVEAIMASYDEFGQVKPIIARKDESGEITVIAGNHQLEAAKQLGWDQIAVVFLEADDQRALAFAITENRTTELGYTDESLLYEALGEIVDGYSDLVYDLGWDEFEFALLETMATPQEHTPGVYHQPIINMDAVESEKDLDSTAQTKMGRDAESAVLPVAVRDEEGEARFTAPPGIDQKSAIATGSSAVSIEGGSRAIIQYSLVFDGAVQQKRWFDFVRWLRDSDGIEGETTSERLLNFLENVAEF